LVTTIYKIVLQVSLASALQDPPHYKIPHEIIEMDMIEAHNLRVLTAKHTIFDDGSEELFDDRSEERFGGLEERFDGSEECLGAL
jgi:hypothetical protein